MADFALWAAACETALGPVGTFWSAYCSNRDGAVEGVIDAGPIAATVRAVMAIRMEWTGTASDLLGLLTEAAGELLRSKTWPDSGAGRAAKAGGNLPAPDRHCGRVRARGPRADQDDPHHGRARKRRDETARTVRTVRYQRQQGLRGR
jgi:hypothetical protein